jgi:hypothetical protein
MAVPPPQASLGQRANLDAFGSRANEVCRTRSLHEHGSALKNASIRCDRR